MIKPQGSYTLNTITNGPPCCDPVVHLEVRNLCVSIAGSAVLENISLDVYKGCVTTIIGPSGCGKSSFLSVFNRMTDFIPDARVSGSVRFGGVDILSGKTDTQILRRKIGMIFQKPNPFPLSIHRNLELPLIEHGYREKSRRNEKIENALRDVGIWNEVKDRLHKPATTLSGGQQQRLCIARALVLEPEVLLMDEPCSALDPMSSKVVEELICSLQGRITIIVVTHNLAQARRIGNYVGFFWMSESSGKLIEFGKSNQIFEMPENDLTRAYIQGLSG